MFAGQLKRFNFEPGQASGSTGREEVCSAEKGSRGTKENLKQVLSVWESSTGTFAMKKN
jgi:hypothetical protein